MSTTDPAPIHDTESGEEAHPRSQFGVEGGVTGTPGSPKPKHPADSREIGSQVPGPTGVGPIPTQGPLPSEATHPGGPPADTDDGGTSQP